MKPTFDKTRPASWSFFSAYWYDKQSWYRKYVLNQEDPASIEMTFGKTVGERLASDPSYLPQVIRYSEFEHQLGQSKDGVGTPVKFGKIPLVGFIDTADIPEKKFREYKTGKKAWTQKRVDEHGQITMYLLMLYLRDKTRPEDFTVHLDWLPTEESLESIHDTKSSIRFIHPFEVQSFQTKRTMKQVLAFGALLNKTYREMEEYCQNYRAWQEI